MANTLTKIDFLDKRKGTPSDPLDEPLTLLFDPEPHAFAIGQLKKIRDWVPKGKVAVSQQLHVISSISVSSQGAATVYTVVAREPLFGNTGSHMLILTGRVVPGDPYPPESTYWLGVAVNSSGNDPRIERAREILEGGAQRQDSFSDQLRDAERLLTAAGMYDVLTWIHDGSRR